MINRNKTTATWTGISFCKGLN